MVLCTVALDRRLISVHLARESRSRQRAPARLTMYVFNQSINRFSRHLSPGLRGKARQDKLIAETKTVPSRRWSGSEDATSQVALVVLQLVVCLHSLGTKKRSYTTRGLKVHDKLARRGR